MTPTHDPNRILMDEHRVIEGVLACLEAMADGCRAGHPLDAEDARAALDFFRSFADRFHHGKEESELFVMMEAKGLPAELGPTAQMRHEHEQGRARIRAMAEAVDRTDGAAFALNAEAYVRMLREHIQKEDHCLFPMTAELFAEDDVEALARRFDEVEAQPGMRELRDRSLAIARGLAERYSG